MRTISLLFILWPLSFVWVQEGQKEKQPQEQQKIPTTLAEAHAELERILSPKELAKIDKMPSEGGMVEYHFGLGMGIRNSWGLWQGGPLAKHLRELGFIHPDDMSGVILETFWCKRHGQPFRLEERAAEYKKGWEATLKADEEEKKRVETAKATIRNIMMGLRFERQEIPTVRMPDRSAKSLRARSLSFFRGGVFITVRRLMGKKGDTFATQGYYFDPADRRIHGIRVNRISDVHSAVVAGDTAWFAGLRGKKAVLAGVSDPDRITLPLPEAGQPPQLGVDGQSLLAVYPKTIYQLTGQKWMVIHSGDISLPRSGLPPQRYGDMVFFRDEGIHEDGKRLWWLTLGEERRITSLDRDVGVVGPEGPRWENSFSYCVTSGGDLWACVGEGYARKSLLRRSKDRSYSVAIMNNSVQFTEDLFGSKETDQGLSVSAVAPLPDGALVLVGDAGLYRLKDNELVQTLAFTNTHQGIPISDGGVLHWNWDPSNVLVLDDKSYFISGAFGGVYLLSEGDDRQWTFLSLDETLGDTVVW